jgi:ribonucleoside-triphosphate reductase (thioredoxin)
MNTAIPSETDCGLPDYISASRYARHSAQLGRRENWHEAVARVLNMHLFKFPDVELGSVAGLPGTLHAAIKSAFDAVQVKAVLPSMRSLQFGGKAIIEKNARVFNCAFSHANRAEFFGEALWLLLCGTGAGFSVQKQHVSQIPALAVFDATATPSSYWIPDTIEGWADAVTALVRAHIAGTTLDFNYSMIRPAGAPLKTSGGKAPGPEPLKTALDNIRNILLGASGRPLKSIEAYDIVMFSAQAVLSGGIRRSATICLFSPDDEEMMSAKTGNWFETNPQRSASNNSAVLNRKTATRAQFDRLFEAQKEFGEPGFFFVEDEDHGCNPCVEISLNPTLVVTEEAIDKLRAYGYSGCLEVGQKLSGWQMCNLTTTNGAKAKTPEAFYDMVAKAAVIGTLQAAYTKFDYLGAVSRLITENEALLGVSICGILDNPDVLLDPVVLETGASIAKQVNAAVAKAIGINPAARVTAVKPEGTASLLLGAGSGIHPHHARHYFRRVQANKHDPVFRHFAAANPHMIEQSVYDKSGNTMVITFPVCGPEKGIYRQDLTAERHLAAVNLVQRHWVQAGRAHENFTKGIHHNVSNTITVRSHEWDSVANYIWGHRDSFTGVSLLADSGDKTYQQAPREAVVTQDDMHRWQDLVARFQAVNFDSLMEAEDSTRLKEVVACAGGSCELAA